MKITKAYLKKLIKEEIDTMDDEEYSGYPSPSFTPEEKKVREQIKSLVDAIEKMEKSNPEMTNPDMTDDYIFLFRALEKAGVSPEGILRLT